MARKLSTTRRLFVSFAAEDSTTFHDANHYFLAPSKFTPMFVVALRDNEPSDRAQVARARRVPP
jgi:hypothetical protein